MYKLITTSQPFPDSDKIFKENMSNDEQERWDLKVSKFPKTKLLQG